MVLWNICFIRGCFQDKGKNQMKKCAADQIWLPLNILYNLLKRTEGIDKSFRFRKNKRKWQARFQFLLHLPASDSAIEYLLFFGSWLFSLQAGFVLIHYNRKCLWVSHPLRRIPQHPLPQGGLPANMCLFFSSLTRHNGWTSEWLPHWCWKSCSTILNWKHAHW